MSYGCRNKKLFTALYMFFNFSLSREEMTVYQKSRLQKKNPPFISSSLISCVFSSHIHLLQKPLNSESVTECISRCHRHHHHHHYIITATFKGVHNPSRTKTHKCSIQDNEWEEKGKEQKTE